MSTETRDFAKLGKTMWLCEIVLDDGVDPRSATLASAEYPNLGLAKAWVNRTLPTFWRQVAGRPWADIRRGAYVDESFHDGGYGHVSDAGWEADDRSQWYGELASDCVTVEWQDDSC